MRAWVKGNEGDAGDKDASDAGDMDADEANNDDRGKGDVKSKWAEEKAKDVQGRKDVIILRNKSFLDMNLFTEANGLEKMTSNPCGCDTQ